MTLEETVEQLEEMLRYKDMDDVGPFIEDYEEALNSAISRLNNIIVGRKYLSQTFNKER